MLNLARQLAHQIIIKAEGEAQQTLVRNQAAPVTFQLGQFWWVSGDQNSSASSAVHCPFIYIYIYTIYINLLQADVAQFKYRQQARHSVPSSVSLRVARWALGGTVQVLAEGYSKALNFFSSSGQEKDACDVNFWCLRMEHPPSYVYIYIYYIYITLLMSSARAWSTCSKETVFYYALCLPWKLAFRSYRVSISCFLFYRGPLFGFSTKYHRDGGSDSIGGKILL